MIWRTNAGGLAGPVAQELLKGLQDLLARLFPGGSYTDPFGKVTMLEKVQEFPDVAGYGRWRLPDCLEVTIYPYHSEAGMRNPGCLIVRSWSSVRRFRWLWELADLMKRVGVTQIEIEGDPCLGDGWTNPVDIDFFKDQVHVFASLESACEQELTEMASGLMRTYPDVIQQNPRLAVVALEYCLGAVCLNCFRPPSAAEEATST